MSDLVGNPEDRFSQNEAHIDVDTQAGMSLCRKHRGFCHVAAYLFSLKVLCKYMSLEFYCIKFI